MLSCLYSASQPGGPDNQWAVLFKESESEYLNKNILGAKCLLKLLYLKWVDILSQLPAVLPAKDDLQEKRNYFIQDFKTCHNQWGNCHHQVCQLRCTRSDRDGKGRLFVAANICTVYIIFQIRFCAGIKRILLGYMSIVRFSGFLVSNL